MLIKVGNEPSTFSATMVGVVLNLAALTPLTQRNAPALTQLCDIMFDQP